MNTMPVAYLENVHLEFADGRVWEINIREQLSKTNPDDIADKLLNTLQEYKDEIKKIDFKVDVDQLKLDIKDQTKNML